MKRIREFLESVVFAGLKPSGGPAAPRQDRKWLGPLQGSVDRFLSGGATPNDPLYLTNRTSSQKMRTWSLIAVPCLVLAAGIAGTLYILEPPEPKAVQQPTSAEIASKLLPNIAKDVKLTPPANLQVLEVRIANTRLSGIVQNTTNREINFADLVIELTNASGSQLGAVSTTIEKIPASGRREFEVPIKQHDAAFALVREITTR